jgi:hypothetical protein
MTRSRVHVRQLRVKPYPPVRVISDNFNVIAYRASKISSDTPRRMPVPLKLICAQNTGFRVRVNVSECKGNPIR